MWQVPLAEALCCTAQMVQSAGAEAVFVCEDCRSNPPSGRGGPGAPRRCSWPRTRRCCTSARWTSTATPWRCAARRARDAGSRDRSRWFGAAVGSGSSSKVPAGDSRWWALRSATGSARRQVAAQTQPLGHLGAWEGVEDLGPQAQEYALWCARPGGLSGRCGAALCPVEGVRTGVVAFPAVTFSVFVTGGAKTDKCREFHTWQEWFWGDYLLNRAGGVY